MNIIDNHYELEFTPLEFETIGRHFSVKNKYD